jgi:hypothetical protein
MSIRIIDYKWSEVQKCFIFKDGKILILKSYNYFWKLQYNLRYILYVHETEIRRDWLNVFSFLHMYISYICRVLYIFDVYWKRIVLNLNPLVLYIPRLGWRPSSGLFRHCVVRVVSLSLSLSKSVLDFVSHSSAPTPLSLEVSAWYSRLWIQSNKVHSSFWIVEMYNESFTVCSYCIKNRHGQEKDSTVYFSRTRNFEKKNSNCNLIIISSQSFNFFSLLKGTVSPD